MGSTAGHVLRRCAQGRRNEAATERRRCGVRLPAGSAVGFRAPHPGPARHLRRARRVDPCQRRAALRTRCSVGGADPGRGGAAAGRRATGGRGRSRSLLRSSFRCAGRAVSMPVRRGAAAAQHRLRQLAPDRWRLGHRDVSPRTEDISSTSRLTSGVRRSFLFIVGRVPVHALSGRRCHQRFDAGDLHVHVLCHAIHVRVYAAAGHRFTNRSGHQGRRQPRANTPGGGEFASE